MGPIPNYEFKRKGRWAELIMHTAKKTENKKNKVYGLGLI